MANRKAEQVLGVGRDKLIGLNFNNVTWNLADFEGEPISEDSLPFKVVLRTGRPVFNVPLTVLDPDGERIFLVVNAAPIKNANYEIESVVSTIDDVTNRIAAQAALDESLTTSRDIVDGIPIGLIIYRFEPPDRLFLQRANPNASIVLRTELKKEIGSEYNEIWEQEVVGQLKERILRSIRSGRSTRLEDLTIESSMMNGAFRVSIFPLPGDRVCVAYEDVTRQMMEEYLRRRAHMQMEQNIEHFATLVDEIRNPLSVILAISELSECKDMPRVRGQAETIEAILKQLDKGWVESEKVRAFLRKYI